MYFTQTVLVLATAITLAHGFSIGEATGFLSKFKRQSNVTSLVAEDGGNACPAIWKSVAAELSANYLNSTNGQCTALARQAIRAGFHDCGAWNLSLGETGGCDGSLFQVTAEFERVDNLGMQQVGDFLLALLPKFPGISMADLIQFSASTAIVTCPLGPQVQTFVGRNDSFLEPPHGLLPFPNQTAEFISNLFTAKGFDAEELAALIGAHTASQQFFVNVTLAGEPQDDTPGIWDVDFYADTNNPPAGVFRFDSDILLSQDPTVGKQFQGFVGNQGKWNGKFAKAQTKMSLNGVPGGSSKLIDCTSALPAGTKSRMVRAAPINDRIR